MAFHFLISFSFCFSPLSVPKNLTVMLHVSKKIVPSIIRSSLQNNRFINTVMILVVSLFTLFLIRVFQIPVKVIRQFIVIKIQPINHDYHLHFFCNSYNSNIFDYHNKLFFCTIFQIFDVSCFIFPFALIINSI